MGDSRSRVWRTATRLQAKADPHRYSRKKPSQRKFGATPGGTQKHRDKLKRLWRSTKPLSYPDIDWLCRELRFAWGWIRDLRVKHDKLKTQKFLDAMAGGLIYDNTLRRAESFTELLEVLENATDEEGREDNARDDEDVRPGEG